MVKKEWNFEVSYDIQEHGKQADTEVTQNTLILFIWSVHNKQRVMDWPVATKGWNRKEWAMVAVDMKFLSWVSV